MARQAVTQAELEVVRFLVGSPSLEEIVAFRVSPEVDDRVSELLEINQERALTEDEAEEIEAFMYLEHLMRMLKIEAHGRIGRKPS